MFRPLAAYVEWMQVMLEFAGSADAVPTARGLLARARKGDLAAFEDLMAMHQRMVMAVAYRLLGSKEDAKDASQEVFLRLHGGLARLDEERELAPWLYRVTVNICHDLRRKQRHWVALDEAREIAERRPDAEQVLTDFQRRRTLAEGLARLPEKERAAVLLRDIEGLSTAEVAAILESTEATVRSQISVARGKLRKFAERVWRRRP